MWATIKLRPKATAMTAVHPEVSPAFDAHARSSWFTRSRAFTSALSTFPFLQEHVRGMIRFWVCCIRLVLPCMRHMATKVL
jgi:hypothetical protein